MKVLLTGSTGFIGNAFLRKAIARGHKVGALILPELVIPKDLEKDENIVWMRGTLKNPPWELIEKFQPEACVHTAWITTPGIYLESPENYELLEDSLQFIMKAVSISTNYVLVTGTCLEYAQSYSPLKEDESEIKPESTYAKCKHELHVRLIEASKSMNFDLCWTRIFYPYGLGEHPEKLCSFLIRKLLYNDNVYIKYPENVRDYIYIDDLVAALILILEKRFTGTINIATGAGISVREIANMIANSLNKTHLLEQPPISLREDYIIADITKLKSLGWKQKVSMKEGIQKLIDYWTEVINRPYPPQ